MRQFDAFQNPSSESRRVAPYLVVLSSHHLRDLSEVVVAPAVNDATRTVGELEIPIEINGKTLTLLISELFSLTTVALRLRAASLI
ncbi:CcdB family protein, partial [Caulobacter sp.]|uniref:CcdB family protein n=1 Tax=Caulobacter sp. TaxID=78 RepID=UPI002B479E5E